MKKWRKKAGRKARRPWGRPWIICDCGLFPQMTITLEGIETSFGRQESPPTVVMRAEGSFFDPTGRVGWILVDKPMCDVLYKVLE